MRKFFSAILSAAMLFTLTSCSAPAERQQYDTVSQTIKINAVDNAVFADYPPENEPIEGVFDTGATEMSATDVTVRGKKVVKSESSGSTGSASTSASSNELRGAWVSFFEFEEILKGKSEAQFKNGINKVFDNLKDAGFNTAIVQVRPYSDAIYKSSYFPWSYLATGTEGGNPGFDPLAIMVKEAHSRGLKIEAWINPYRVRAGLGKDLKLAGNNPAKKWLDSGDSAVIKYDGCVYYNPASKKAQQLIVDGVKEIVKNYDVDGIHFDDYFYPTTDAAFDKASYEQYKSGGGKLSLASWRRENVNTLVRSVYSAVKELDSSVIFGVSPQGNNDNNYNQQYVDVSEWFNNPGYVDYICPQIYWGFNHKSAPFKETVEKWNRLAGSSKVKLYIGLAPYRLGNVDGGAGESGKNEWKNTSDILARMVKTSRTQSSYGGFVMFRYMSLFEPEAYVRAQADREIASLKEVLK